MHVRTVIITRNLCILKSLLSWKACTARSQCCHSSILLRHELRKAKTDLAHKDGLKVLVAQGLQVLVAQGHPQHLWLVFLAFLKRT